MPSFLRQLASIGRALRSRGRGFRGFEAGPLDEVLRIVAEAQGTTAGQLQPGDPLDDGRGSLAAIERGLAARGLAVDLGRLRTVRQLVGAAVPLLERRPTAHW